MRQKKKLKNPKKKVLLKILKIKTLLKIKKKWKNTLEVTKKKFLIICKGKTDLTVS